MVQAREGQEEWGQRAGSRLEFVEIAKVWLILFLLIQNQTRNKPPILFRPPFPQLTTQMRHDPLTSAAAHAKKKHFF